MSDTTSPRKTTGPSVILVVAQHKGGDGKTTITRLIGEFASRQGYQTLLLDTDDQCSLSRRFLKMENNPADIQDTIPPVHPDWTEADNPADARTSVVSLYDGTGVWPYPVRQQGREDAGNLWIIPSSGSALRALKEAKRQDEIRERLRKFLRLPDVQSEYDLIVIDTPPNKEKITVSGIRAATHMLIPTQLQSQSIEGLNGMVQAWRAEHRVRADDDPLELIGILPNRVQKVALQEGILASLRAEKAIAPMVMDVLLPLRTGIAEADHPAALPRSVFDLPAGDPNRIACEDVCAEIFARLNLPVTLAPHEPSKRAKPAPSKKKRSKAKTSASKPRQKVTTP